MPLVRFLGFPTGASVYLAASQGAHSDSVTVSPWNVARTTEDLAISVVRGAPAFRRAPEVIWVEAMPSGFSGLTPTVQVPEPAGVADWQNGPGAYAGFDAATTPESDRPVLIRIASVQAGTSPSGVLFEAGGTTYGLAAAFDGAGDLVIGVGDGAATATGEGAIFLTIASHWFVDTAVDVWIAHRVDPGRLRAYVVDSATQEIRTVATRDLDHAAGASEAALAALFAGGEAGHWFDVSDLATLARNSDGTGAVSVGDPVGYIADKSGNGNHATAEGEARPILRQDSAGRYYLDFDGVDDVMTTPAHVSASAAGLTAGLAVKLDGTGGNGVIYGPTLAKGWQMVDFGWYLRFDTDSGGLVDDSEVYPADRPDPMSLLGVADPFSVTAYVDGIGSGRTGSFVYSAEEMPTALMGRVSGSNLFTDGRFYGAIQIDRPVDRTERDLVQSFLDGLIATSSGTVPWSDGDGVGVGQAAGAVRAGIAAGPFDGTMGEVAIWGDQLPPDFGEDNPVRYQPEFHEIFYEWSCTRASDGRRLVYTAPQNVPDAFRDASRQIGKTACFVIDAPGDWTIYCTARQIRSVDPLTFVEVTQSLQVAVGPRLDGPTEGDPIWTADNTLVLSADGDFAGAPTGQQLTYGGMDAAALRIALSRAYAEADVGDGTRALRLLLKRGETNIPGDWYDGPEIHASSTGENFDHLYVGTWGEGANPVTRGLKDNGWTNQSWRMTTAIFDGIDIEGSLDHVLRDYTGDDDQLDQFIFPVESGQVRLFNRCRVADKWSIGFYLLDRGVDPAAPSVVAIANCACDGVTNYAVFGSAGESRGMKTAVLGLRAVHPADAPKYLLGEGPGTIRGKNHGPIRLAGQGDLVIDGCDFFSVLGWTAGQTWPDGTPQVAAQPCIRLGSQQTDDPITKTTGRFRVSRCVGEGGAFVSAGNLDALGPMQVNLLVDGNYFLGAANAAPFGATEGGAVTFRNNAHVFWHVAGALALDQARAHALAPRNGVTADALAQEPVADYCNTVVVLGDHGAPFEDVALAEDVEVFTIGNNAIYAPDIAGQPGHTDLAPFDPAELFAARYSGRFEGGYDAAPVTALATPAGTASLYAPQPGSPVEGGATAGYVALFDLVGAARWPYATTGAVQVA